MLRIRDGDRSDPGRKEVGSGIRNKHSGSATLLFWVMRPRNKPPGSRAPQTSDEIYTCTKSYGAKFEILIKLFLENVEIFHNCLKLPFFDLKIRPLFTDFFRIRFRIRFRIQIWIRFRIQIRIRIRNVYFGSGSDPDPAKSFESLRMQHCI